MSTLETMYSARTPMSTRSSSKGIFLDACIITRMMTRLVLREHSQLDARGRRLEHQARRKTHEGAVAAATDRARQRTSGGSSRRPWWK